MAEQDARRHARILETYDSGVHRWSRLKYHTGVNGTRITTRNAPQRGFILADTLVLAGLGFQLFRVSAAGIILY